MNLKQLLFTSILATTLSPTFSQRVKRKGTTPIELKGPSEPAAKFSLDQLQGKWQEYTRIEIGANTKEEFKDTLMVRIDRNTAEVREGMSLNMKGEASIEAPNELTIAGDTYSINTITENELAIDDGQFLKTLKKVSQFYLETVGKDSVKAQAYNVPQNILPANLQGKWIVYRREAKPGLINSNTELIKSLSIVNDSTGEIVVYKNDQTEKLTCTIAIKQNSFTVSANNKQWEFIAYKADNNEFVFGKENEVLNFAKKL